MLQEFLREQKTEYNHLYRNIPHYRQQIIRINCRFNSVLELQFDGQKIDADHENAWSVVADLNKVGWYFVNSTDDDEYQSIILSREVYVNPKEDKE